MHEDDGAELNSTPDSSWQNNDQVNCKQPLDIKSQKSSHESHRMQLISYLKLSQKKLGLLLNFGMEKMMEGVSRVVKGL